MTLFVVLYKVLESDQIFFVDLKYSRSMHIPIPYCHEVINKDIGKENWFLTGFSPLKWAGDAVSRVVILSLSHCQFQILSRNPDLNYYFFPIQNTSLNFIQS